MSKFVNILTSFSFFVIKHNKRAANCGCCPGL
nr:MAG TPA: hypothetical protein [Caudoviricetes sp.]